MNPRTMPASNAVAPVFGHLLLMASRAFAFSMEFQMNWLTLPAPHASSHVATLGRQAQPTADELAYSMDIAIGEPSAGNHAQPTVIAPERWASRAA